MPFNINFSIIYDVKVIILSIWIMVVIISTFVQQYAIKVIGYLLVISSVMLFYDKISPDKYSGSILTNTDLSNMIRVTGSNDVNSNVDIF